MKSNGIQHAVRAVRHNRSPGDAPSLGRLARMPGTGLPKPARVRRRRKFGARSSGSHHRQGRQTTIFATTFLLMGGAMLVVGLAAWLWVIPKMAENTQQEAQTKTAIEPMITLASKFPSPSESEAVDLVKRAIAVRDPSQVSAYFRPSDTPTEQIVKFLANLESSDGILQDLNWLSSIDSNGLSVDGVVVNFDENSKNHSRLALLTPNAEGKWLLDFDAFARTVAPSWEQILNPETKTALVRVSIARDNYYNGFFKNEEDWVCYGMASPDSESILFGYCKANSPQAAALKWIFAKGGQMNRVTLELRRHEDGGSRQFEISRVFASDWLVGDTALDEGFK